MKNGKKLLILGAGSFIGRQMMDRLGRDQVIATYNRTPFDGGILFDAVNQNLSDIVAPSEIWHCMILYADSHPDSCAKNLVQSTALNVESTKRVIDQLCAWDIPFTFTSSEAVFNGRVHNATEDTPADPIMVYGRQKRLVETYLSDNFPTARWTIMRLGKVFGASASNEKLFTGWIDQLEKGEVIRIATDQVFSPIFVDDVVNACLVAAEKQVYGLYHLCGTEAFGRLDLLEMTIRSVRRYRAIEPKIERCSIDDFGLFEVRAKDVSMRPDKLIAATGLDISRIASVCDRIVDSYFQPTGDSEG